MNSFDLIIVAGSKAKWSSSSMVIAMCHFVDQLHERLPGTEDDGVLGDFERYLNNQIEQERDANEIVFEGTVEEVIEFLHSPDLESDLILNSDRSEFFQLINVCPRCGTEDTDTTTIADHGMCSDCLSKWKAGELPEQQESD